VIYAAFKAQFPKYFVVLKMQTKSYNAKILLFGEYTILNGSHALAMPITRFSGKWVFSKDKQAKDLKSNLVAFADYLDELAVKGGLLSDLNLQNFKTQLLEGLYFNSNIPHGYGAGSSGALCAAVFDRFSTLKILNPTNEDLLDLRLKLAQLESFFHGKSSGIDPLISLINQPVLIKPDQNNIVQLPTQTDTKGVVFLLDTGIQRKTEPFVHLFKEKCKDEEFVDFCKQIVLHNEKAIDCFLNAEWEELFETIHQISLLQLEHFNEMIPNDFVSIWKKGLESKLYKLKLCGAGGGGFILGFTNDFEQAALAISEEKLIPIFRF